MKKKLLFNALKLLFIGFRLTHTKNKMSKLIDLKIKKGQPLTDKKLLRLQRHHDKLMFKWNKVEKEYLNSKKLLTNDEENQEIFISNIKPPN